MYNFFTIVATFAAFIFAPRKLGGGYIGVFFSQSFLLGSILHFARLALSLRAS